MGAVWTDVRFLWTGLWMGNSSEKSSEKLLRTVARVT